MGGTLRIVRTVADEKPRQEDVTDLPGQVPWPCQGEGRGRGWSPMPRARDAAASHGWLNRWIVSNWCDRPLPVTSSLNRPPRPTACSWRGSPTRTSRHRCVSASRVSWWRSLVPSIPASSTINVLWQGVAILLVAAGQVASALRG